MTVKRISLSPPFFLSVFLQVARDEIGHVRIIREALGAGLCQRLPACQSFILYWQPLSKQCIELARFSHCCSDAS
jgi:hypothetical protein